MEGNDKTPAPVPLKDFLLYFLRLGATGFGGPIALVGYMQRDLVEERGWISKEDYAEGLALAQLSPGPLAAQLAIYLGWVRGGILGSTLVGVAFVLPSFLMVVVLAALYLRFGGLPWLQWAFYGIAASVIAIVSRSAVKLGKMTLGKDPLLWLFAAVTAVVTVWTQSEVAWAFLACGVASVLVKAPPKFGKAGFAAVMVSGWPAVLTTGLHGVALPGTLTRIAWFFTKSGAFVFGSGLAIVPFLYAGVVKEFHWLNDRQFLDAVAVAMITPGPVVITVGFIGFLVAGLSGAVVAALGTFLPCYLLTVIPAPFFHRSRQSPRIKALVDGVTAAATGAIAGAAITLGRRAIVDVPTTLIALLTLTALLKAKRIPEPVLILAAGVAGLLMSYTGR
ncbi:MAG TPA: chromate transporter [Candidatus Deferrimicrobiaceae bacterium]